MAHLVKMRCSSSEFHIEMNSSTKHGIFTGIYEALSQESEIVSALNKSSLHSTRVATVNSQKFRQEKSIFFVTESCQNIDRIRTEDNFKVRGFLSLEESRGAT